LRHQGHEELKIDPHGGRQLLFEPMWCHKLSITTNITFPDQWASTDAQGTRCNDKYRRCPTDKWASSTGYIKFPDSSRDGYYLQRKKCVSSNLSLVPTNRSIIHINIVSGNRVSFSRT
jgi:hypothetical protein